jgi:hypothetical protein
MRVIALLLVASFVPCAGAQPALYKGPGTIIDYSPAASKQYIGSPSIVARADGSYLVSHDFFGPGSTRDVTVVFASADRGKTWQQRASIKGQWWSTLFEHAGALYLMGTSKEYGYTVIRRSTDAGQTWTTPVDRATGLLLDDGKYHCAPVPVVVHGGRLWRAMEDAQGPGPWGQHFRAFMMSAPADADLLRADSWTSSNRIGRDPAWLGGKFNGWLEGNAVVTPQGKIVNLLRVDCAPLPDRAAWIDVSDDGTKIAFDPAGGFIEFPGGSVKFNIRFDPVSKHYWSLTSIGAAAHPERKPAQVRNTLGLIRSADLKSWETRGVVLHHPDVLKHAFQYVDWLFDGDDLIAASRTAYDDGAGGAHNAHDANFLTFHRIANFRTFQKR